MECLDFSHIILSSHPSLELEKIDPFVVSAHDTTAHASLFGSTPSVGHEGTGLWTNGKYTGARAVWTLFERHRKPHPYSWSIGVSSRKIPDFSLIPGDTEIVFAPDTTDWLKGWKNEAGEPTFQLPPASSGLVMEDSNRWVDTEANKELRHDLQLTTSAEGLVAEDSAIQEPTIVPLRHSYPESCMVGSGKWNQECSGRYLWSTKEGEEREVTGTASLTLELKVPFLTESEEAIMAKEIAASSGDQEETQTTDDNALEAAVRKLAPPI